VAQALPGGQSSFVTSPFITSQLESKGRAMNTASVFNTRIKPAAKTALKTAARWTGRTFIWLVVISVAFAVLGTAAIVTINQVNPSLFQSGNIQYNDFSMAMGEDFFAMEFGDAALGLLTAAFGLFIAFWAVLFAVLVVMVTFLGVGTLFVGLALLFALPALLLALPVWLLVRRSNRKAMSPVSGTPGAAAA
jgi:hypothetical protein